MFVVSTVLTIAFVRSYTFTVASSNSAPVRTHARLQEEYLKLPYACTAAGTYTWIDYRIIHCVGLTLCCACCAVLCGVLMDVQRTTP